MVDRNSPALEELNRLDRFIAAYNAIDQYLRKRTQEKKETPFGTLLKRYEETKPSWSDGDQLRKYADLRNVLIHSRTKPGEVLAIPTTVIVEDIEGILARLKKKISLTELGASGVISLKTKSKLPEVLNLIRENDFSQFPVYDEDGTFCGLLTENGLTRWLANENHQRLEMIDLNDWDVASLLDNEEERTNCTFLSRNTEFDTVIDQFRKNIFLEAVIITETKSK